MFTQTAKAKVMLFLTVLALLCVVFPAQPAVAGLNGQQLEIMTSRKDNTGKVGYKAMDVRFTGTNNAGQIYTYSESFSTAVYEKRFPGFWWKGRLLATITVYDMTTKRHLPVQCFIDVPIRQISNYTTIMFSSSRCWKR